MPFAADDTMEDVGEHAKLQANGRHDPAEMPAPYPGFVLNDNPVALSEKLHELYEQVISPPREKQNGNAADKYENLAWTAFSFFLVCAATSTCDGRSEAVLSFFLGLRYDHNLRRTKGARRFLFLVP